MSDYQRPLRAPWTPVEGSHEAFVMGFMWDHNHRGYAETMMNLHDDFYMIQAEAGPGHGFCEETQRRLDLLDQMLLDNVADAVDRYDDWASDPLP